MNPNTEEPTMTDTRSDALREIENHIDAFRRSAAYLGAVRDELREGRRRRDVVTMIDDHSSQVASDLLYAQKCRLKCLKREDPQGEVGPEVAPEPSPMQTLTVIVTEKDASGVFQYPSPWPLTYTVQVVRDLIPTEKHDAIMTSIAVQRCADLFVSPEKMIVTHNSTLTDRGMSLASETRTPVIVLVKNNLTLLFAFDGEVAPVIDWRG